MADSSSFRAAKQKLEDQMKDKQQRLMYILTGNCRYESPSAEEAAKEVLENEIEDRKNAIERLETQSYCDTCGTQADVRETCRIRVTKCNEKLPTMKLMMEKVLVTVECVDCRRKHDSEQRAERTVPTTDEIVRAFDMLTPEERRKLNKFADQRARVLEWASCGSSGEDLLHDALVATLESTQNTGAGKHWNKSGVDFPGHLKFAIRGISWGWGQKRKEFKPCSEAGVIRCDDEGQKFNPLNDIDSDDPSVVALAPWLPRSAPRPDKSLIANEEIERKHKIFANNKEASAVFDAQLEGVTTAREIMQEQRLTRRQYEAAQRRIRSQKSALIIEEDDHVLELMARWLKAMDFAVVATGTMGEGLRIYRECGPFGVVIVSCSLDLNGVGLAMDIRKRNHSQRMIITTPYSSEEDVVVRRNSIRAA